MARPRQYKTVKELEDLIEDYFDSCWIDKVVEVTDKEGNITTTNSRYQNRPYTVTGLALHLNLTRQGLINYQGRKEFIDTVTRAKVKVEMFAEESLFTVKNSNGVSFALKNNFSWTDKQELIHSGTIKLEDVVAGGE